MTEKEGSPSHWNSRTHILEIADNLYSNQEPELGCQILLAEILSPSVILGKFFDFRVSVSSSEKWG